ncbi:hypothetical protein [Clavibacter sp. Sh2088]|uniref:hypothetical protein n=1 Tax=Clavibacter sp. Sh2088 TaxID=3397676 RepID=UPI0039E16126
MRSLRLLLAAALSVGLLAGCASVARLVNGAQTVREESWIRSDGTECTTGWTLGVIDGFDQRDGPIERFEEALLEADPGPDGVAAAHSRLEGALRDRGPAPSPDGLLRLEADARGTAVLDEVTARLRSEGLGDDLPRFEMRHATDCG